MNILIYQYNTFSLIYVKLILEETDTQIKIPKVTFFPI